MLRQQLFALDCVTFEADARKINPALWKERAGDIDPFIVPWTHPHLATGPAVKRERGGGGKDAVKERAPGPHTHSYTSCLLMSLKPEVISRKQMAVHPRGLED